MDRLQTQTHRLYLPPATRAGPASGLMGTDGRVRAMVLALCQPADWATLAPLWQGVQADLGWPAPAIAVNGVDGFELWFSLAEALPRAEAAQLLARLQRRYLADLRPERVRAWPGADAATVPPACPPFAAGPERWAAFVTPDLPAVFGDDPALDFQPGDDAQAELLVRQRSITAAELRTARALLEAAEPPAAGATEPAEKAHVLGATTTVTGSFQDPRAFLLAVMNDPAAPLALRIEAAKGLLHAPDIPGR